MMLIALVTKTTVIIVSESKLEVVVKSQEVHMGDRNMCYSNLVWYVRKDSYKAKCPF